MELNIKKLSPMLGDTVPFPCYASPGAAAMDIGACILEDVTLAPGERVMIETGFALAAPPGMVALLFGRSGLGIKQGITLANCVGVVDSDYRGEVKVGLVNHGDVSFTIHRGDRIAQMALMPVMRAELVLTESLEETKRGEGGFGSTGIKG